MAEVVAAPLLSASMKVLMERLADKQALAWFLGWKSDSEKLLDDLHSHLISAKVLLSDAEEKQFFDDGVKTWLCVLKDLIYESERATDFLDTLKGIRELKNERRGTILSLASKAIDLLKFVPKMTLKAELEDIVKRLKSHLDQNRNLGLRPLDRYTASSSLASNQSVEAKTCVYGRESEREDIVKSLISPDSTALRITVVPIVGMGGVGKTTLARFVYEDSRLDQFDVKVWVSVSQSFDIRKLTRMILEKVTAMKHDTEDLYSLQTELSEALRGKKFVMVLDDVWNEDFDRWIDFETPLECASRGSKIVVTTRSRKIASMMSDIENTPELKVMSDDACWRLFENRVFRNSVDDGGEELREIGKEIVKKCKGLPLAVRAIAGLMRSVKDPKKWKSVLESNLWDLTFEEKQKTGTLPALWLSYRSLLPELKQCFAYCSIFPKEYEFGEEDLNKLVLLWMAEGLLEGEGRKTMEDRGREYLNELISRSFFQIYSLEHPRTLRMHDLVHDLATRVSPEFCYLSNGCDNLLNTRNKTRHVSYEKDSKPFDTKRLRTMIALPLHSGFRLSSREQIIPTADGCLRAYSVSSRNVSLPRSIGSQKHLRYLDFSFTDIEEIPSAVCELYNLQTLLLVECLKLKKLPAKMSRLIKLRHLDIRETRSLRAMPKNMNKMTQLQTLSCFHVTKGCGSRIKELGDLNLLRGKLEITGIGHVVNVKDALAAKLTNKRSVEELVLRGGNNDDSVNEREVLDALRPHVGLKKLEIHGSRTKILPVWVSWHSFVDMVSVTLEDCNCTVLPALGQLPSLKQLHLESLNKLVSIGDEVCGSSCDHPFPSLQVLSIASMTSLQKWTFASEKTIFPMVYTISVNNCPRLIAGIPFVSFPCLYKAWFSRCPSMERLFDSGQKNSSDFEIMWKQFPCWKRLEIKDCDLLLEKRAIWSVELPENDTRDIDDFIITLRGDVTGEARKISLYEKV